MRERERSVECRAEEPSWGMKRKMYIPKHIHTHTPIYIMMYKV